MEEADFYFLFRAENNTAGTVLDGFEVVLLQPQSWRTANSGMPSHGRQPRDVEGRMNVLMKFKEIDLCVVSSGVTVAGTLDESFSNESQLEIWAPDFLTTMNSNWAPIQLRDQRA